MKGRDFAGGTFPVGAIYLSESGGDARVFPRYARLEIAGCAGSESCGRQGIFSNYGAYPNWSPYKGTKIEEAITFGQNNRFSHNRYWGPWGFTAYDQSRKLTRAQWQADPYAHDRDSLFH